MSHPSLLEDVGTVLEMTADLCTIGKVAAIVANTDKSFMKASAKSVEAGSNALHDGIKTLRGDWDIIPANVLRKEGREQLELVRLTRCTP